MPTIKHFLLPDPAEGLTEAEIVSWKVAVGDQVSVNQPILDIETAKSLVELPCPFTGVVVEILAAEGETVPVGAPVLAVDVDPAEAAAPAGPEGCADSSDSAGLTDSLVPTPPSSAEQPPAPPVQDGGRREPVLVGYGVREGGRRRRRPRRTERGTPEDAPALLNSAFSTERPPSQPVAPPRPPVTVRPVATGQGTRRSLPGVGRIDVAPLPPVGAVMAKPPVRRLARELGVDLATVSATGRAGEVTRDDVLGAHRGAPPGETPDRARTRTQQEALEQRVPIRSVRKATAKAMVTSAFTAPHVSVWAEVDVTRSMGLLAGLNRGREDDAAHVTPLALVARALCLAIRRHPEINAAWEEESGEIVVKHYVNLGIAVAARRGLLVPVVHDADTLDLTSLAGAIRRLVTTARDGKVRPADLSRGTVSITNVGVFGVDGGTPILPPGQSAILCMGRVHDKPWVHQGQVCARKVMQLTMSFDHRLIDGELGALVLAEIASLLEEPGRAITY